MLGTTTSPLGVTIGTWSRTNSFELERTTRPSTLHATDEELVTARSYLKRKRNRDRWDINWLFDFSIVECFPYGLSVRVNAETTLPDELKYKDWSARVGASESNSTRLLVCMMAGLPGRRPWRVSSRVRPDATPLHRLRPKSKAVPRWLHQIIWLCFCRVETTFIFTLLIINFYY